MIEKLIGLLSDYSNIGDSYHYTLGRSKEAFGMGTMSLYDFTEYGEDDAADLAEFLIANGVTVQRWIPVTERLPDEREEDDEGEKHTASDIVQVAVMDSLGNKFVTDDMLCDTVECAAHFLVNMGWKLLGNDGFHDS